MKRITVIALGLVCFTVGATGVNKLVDVVATDFALYQAEGKCATELSQVTERRNIATGNGTCWIK